MKLKDIKINTRLFVGFAVVEEAGASEVGGVEALEGRVGQDDGDGPDGGYRERRG